MMPPELSLITAIQASETRLSATFTKGIDEVKASVSILQNAHSAALLDQAKANATFANRDRVEAIAATNHNNGNHISSLQGKINKLELDAATSGSAHTKLIRDRWDRIAAGATAAAGITLGVILTHFLH